MDDTFLASYGDHDKTVTLSKLKGGYYHIYVDGFYWGQVHFQNDKWTVLLQDPSIMTLNDMEAISDRIAELENTKKPSDLEGLRD